MFLLEKESHFSSGIIKMNTISLLFYKTCMSDTAIIIVCTISVIYLFGLCVYGLTNWCLDECNRTPLPIHEPFIKPGEV